MYKLNDMVDHEKIEEGCCYILQGSDDIIVLKDLEELVLNMLINDGIESTIKKLKETYLGDNDIISYDVENFLEFLTEKEILVEQSKFNTI